MALSRRQRQRTLLNDNAKLLEFDDESSTGPGLTNVATTDAHTDINYHIVPIDDEIAVNGALQHKIAT